MSFVEVGKLWLRYGETIALQGLSFTVEKGELFGLVGPNGAGKTSCLKVLATILKPDGGWVQLDGVDVQARPFFARGRIGWVPDAFGVYEDLTVEEYLHFFAAAYWIERSRRPSLVRDVLELTDLVERIDSPVETLSRGMKQRLALARVLLHDPDLLLLDEPASGLDPRARIEVRELLRELRAMGKTIIVSSHILEDLGQICTSIGIIESGRMAAHGPLDEIYRRLELRRVVHVQLAEPGDGLLEKVRAIDGVDRVDEELDRVSIWLREDALALEDLAARLHGLGARIRMFQPQAMDLETAFLKLTGGGEAGPGPGAGSGSETGPEPGARS